METWGHHLDDNSVQASINDNAVPGQSYQVIDFYNSIDPTDGGSSSRIIGNDCVIQFKDNNGVTRCTLTTGEYAASNFISLCGNDVVTQYTVLGRGRLL